MAKKNLPANFVDAIRDRIDQITQIEINKILEALNIPNSKYGFLFVGTASPDTMKGGSKIDVASYITAPGGVNITLGENGNGGVTGWGYEGYATDDNYSSIQIVLGSRYNDTMSGSRGPDTLIGFNGNDVLNGQNGDDLLLGGRGYDQLIGGSGRDTVSYAGSAGQVSVDLYVGIGGAGDALGDRYDSIENVIGTRYNDYLKGGSKPGMLKGEKGNDTLLAGSGGQTLAGGAGQDKLHGGAGKDTFYFAEAPDRDTVFNFKSGRDTIVFDGSAEAYKVFGHKGQLFKEEFVVTNGGAQNENQHLIFNPLTGALRFDEDGSGEIEAKVVAILPATYLKWSDVYIA
jgi:Ca2+-binding RTX toxin-like protein